MTRVLELTFQPNEASFIVILRGFLVTKENRRVCVWGPIASTQGTMRDGVNSRCAR